MITFIYEIPKLLNNAQLLSMYKSNSLLNQGNDSIVDDTVISDEDEALSKDYLEEAATLVADTMSGYAENLLDEDGVAELESYEFDVTYGTGETAVENTILYRVNMPTYFDQKVLKLLDKQIKAALISFVLYRTAKLKSIEFQAYQSDYDNSLGKILEYLQRRTRTVVRSYRFI